MFPAQGIHPFNYRAYGLSNRASDYRKSVAGSIIKLRRETKLQIKMQFLNLEDRFSITELSDTLIFVCGMQNVHVGASTLII